MMELSENKSPLHLLPVDITFFFFQLQSTHEGNENICSSYSFID